MITALAKNRDFRAEQRTELCSLGHATGAARRSWPPTRGPLPYFFVVNRKGTLTHDATGFDSGARVRAGSNRKLGRMSRTAAVNSS